MEDERKKHRKFEACYKELTRERAALREEVARLRDQLAGPGRKVSDLK